MFTAGTLKEMLQQWDPCAGVDQIDKINQLLSGPHQIDPKIRKAYGINWDETHVRIDHGNIVIPRTRLQKIASNDIEYIFWMYSAKVRISKVERNIQVVFLP